MAIIINQTLGGCGKTQGAVSKYETRASPQGRGMLLALLLFWRTVQCGSLHCQSFQRLPHRNGTEREGERRGTNKDRGPYCLLPSLHQRRLIVRSLPAQSLGAWGLLLTLPIVWVKLATSCGQQIRHAGSDRPDVTESAGNFVTSEPLPPGLSSPQTTGHLNLAFSHLQVLDSSSVVGAEPRSLENETHPCWAFWALGLSAMRNVQRKDVKVCPPAPSCLPFSYPSSLPRAPLKMGLLINDALTTE